MSTYCSAGAAGPCPLQPRTLTAPTEAHQPARVYRRKSQGLATWTRSRLHQLWALCGPPSRRCVDNSKGCPEGDKREERHGHLLTSVTNLGSTLTPTPPPRRAPAAAQPIRAASNLSGSSSSTVHTPCHETPLAPHFAALGWISVIWHRYLQIQWTWRIDCNLTANISATATRTTVPFAAQAAAAHADGRQRRMGRADSAADARGTATDTALRQRSHECVGKSHRGDGRRGFERLLLCH